MYVYNGNTTLLLYYEPVVLLFAFFLMHENKVKVTGSSSCHVLARNRLRIHYRGIDCRARRLLHYFDYNNIYTSRTVLLFLNREYYYRKSAYYYY